ncbi:MAG TPA: glycosyltransferase, partial [Bacteroidales bacterium]
MANLKNKLKLSLFIVPLDVSGASTYYNELVAYISMFKHIGIYIVFTDSNEKEFKIIIKEAFNEVHIPRYFNKSDKTSPRKYYDRCAQLLYIQFSAFNNIIFHFNSRLQVQFAQAIKSLFNCKITYTIHYLSPKYSYYTYSDESNPIEEIDSMGSVNIRKMIEIADKIICVTKFAADSIKKFHGVPDSMIKLIYNGKNVDYQNTTIDKNYLKEQLGFRSSERLILYVGTL